METFNSKLKRLQKQKKSLLCVGLDPQFDRIPKSLRTDPDWLTRFCSEIVQATASFAAAFKPNFAFFEAHGVEGWKALGKLRETVSDDCLIVGDAKRGDIGNSAKQYANAVFQNLDFDAITVNPYMGFDAVEPFLTQAEKGAFCLCLTSNSGAADLQYFPREDSPLYLRVAELVASWNENENCGLVAGATKIPQLTRLRETCPDLPFLIPGVGAQGGDLDEVLSAIQGTNALINASRSIIYASSGNDFGDAAGRAAEKMQTAMAKWF